MDIETTPGAPAFEHLQGDIQELWRDKIAKTAPVSENEEEAYADRAGFYAEFGKIVCISVGYFHVEQNHYQLRLKSFFHDDETVVLRSFLELVNIFHAKHPNFQFAGHNIKEFDIPFICRRSVIHQLSLPLPLQLYGRKPWEVPMLDTLHLWRFGDNKYYTSLKLLTAIMGIDTPKDDIDGSMVGRVYWEEKDLPRIAAYCRKDVLAVAQLLLRFKRMPLLLPEEVTHVQ
ncbi:ribonuclease H-like domain-containing protein [Chitinophaga nivalis]|uniref:Ribonuclease H-like domain-containing protein n=1 Tax=Chitinophaga nivalis TaxID=2991709 RepID=A0ABT3IG00_9BACT|nr:ribonuclease H-like domain-containing protein [Chitinophaga nivalis]MCW3467428.1 ribonuclease H-like domain-containing protein [Chitinophaga nivalis]MCW3482880.1 ribonuclease H-like domain-containing protein [Chitinophaga nivalis]